MFRRSILILLGVAVGGAVYLAHKRAKETGRCFLEVCPEVPGDARRVMDQAVERIKEAVAAGREAAGEKQTEIQTLLNGNN
ncbi:MAG: hypothetical protein GX604_10335 [Actinobacteria bacterium]|nr:hypothetical protein [Actinomycetota bacterium]